MSISSSIRVALNNTSEGGSKSTEGSRRGPCAIKNHKLFRSSSFPFFPLSLLSKDPNLSPPHGCSFTMLPPISLLRYASHSLFCFIGIEAIFLRSFLRPRNDSSSRDTVETTHSVIYLRVYRCIGHTDWYRTCSRSHGFWISLWVLQLTFVRFLLLESIPVSFLGFFLDVLCSSASVLESHILRDHWAFVLFLGEGTSTSERGYSFPIPCLQIIYQLAVGWSPFSVFKPIFILFRFVRYQLWLMVGMERQPCSSHRGPHLTATLNRPPQVHGCRVCEDVCESLSLWGRNRLAS